MILGWLETALDKEKEKYAKCPIIPDKVPGHDAAQGWGYVVAGYVLIEQSFKALLHRHEKPVPRIHVLSKLFHSLDGDDKDVLREFYADYRATVGDVSTPLPFVTLDDFLKNLDGDINRGSFDWRYFLIEEHRSQRMPLIGIEYLHEVARACIQILRHASVGQGNPRLHVRSHRMRDDRLMKYRVWFRVRMNSDGWEKIGDRLEILWGPDYRGRFDLFLFRDPERMSLFSDIPEDLEIPIVDKRSEVANFDPDAALRSIGITRHSPRVR